DHELLGAIVSLERAAENNPDPRAFANAVRELQSLMQKIQKGSKELSPGDPDKFFGLSANRIPKRLDDLDARSKDLLRDPKLRSLRSNTPSNFNSNQIVLDNSLSILVNSLSSDINVDTNLNSSSYGDNLLELWRDEQLLKRLEQAPNSKNAPPVKLDKGQADRLFDLMKQIESSNNCRQKNFSGERASIRNILQDYVMRASEYRDVSPTIREFLKATPVFKARENEQSTDLFSDWVEQWVYEVYPLTLHNIHERLRDLDRTLRRLEQVNVLQRPVFERLKERRQPAVVKVVPGGDGKLVEIGLKPFQAEEGADYELVLGLSRPLNNFEKLRSNVEENPEIHLYVDDKLVERPYLRLEPDLSSDTMLVFRIPKPNLRAGLLGQGLYTPKLLIKRDYLPLVGGDGKISYTFTVGTRRPNVQIIA